MVIFKLYPQLVQYNFDIWISMNQDSVFDGGTSSYWYKRFMEESYFMVL
jgi:hypothetical protein